ncbi:MAG: PD40 domain-containing protein, partial [Planctomycetales bacterium]|nr:PD40 domain-containing protein [Planctomycetales bacterium]
MNSEANENHPAMSSDGLTLYFFSNRPGGIGGTDIWTSTRDAIDSDWTAPANFAAANTPANEFINFVSEDGNTLLFNNGDPLHEDRIYQLTRVANQDEWGTPMLLPAPINDGLSGSRAGNLSADGLIMMFESDRAGGAGNSDIWEAVRPSIDEPWSVKSHDSNINSAVDDVYPVISPDGLTLFFGSQRDGGYGGFDIWVSMRDTVEDEWGIASNLGPTINTSGAENPGQFWEPG